MLRSIQRALLPHLQATKSPSTPTLVRLLHNPADPSSFTISYLVSSCGLSPSAATYAAKKIRLKSPENPDSVLQLFKDHSFSKTQVANLISKHPRLLSADPEKTIKPKLDFFARIGYLDSDVAKLVSGDPNLLLTDLEKTLIPNFDSLKMAFGSAEAALAALKISSRLLRYDIDMMVLPNLEILRNHGMPEPSIIRLATLHPRVLMKEPDRLIEELGQLKQMGLEPSSRTFVSAVHAFSGSTVPSWEKKIAVYKNLGWSEKETLSAFRKYPNFMLQPENKTREMVEFYVKKLGWEPPLLLAKPRLLSLSLEKWVIPRCSVLGLLASKGEVSRGLTPALLMINEEEFSRRFVVKYAGRIPEVLEAYHGNTGSCNF
ncbi:uncharacterized protein [Typha latifolia]|uniref:uncharacterized protein n=1 Tax=Typha latifolia TaxID=4733 RepID=UPI003C2F370F